jgi:hypothetical protein
MQERTFETGGEVLKVGSVVVVFDGNRHREREVTSIGTSRIHIESTGTGKPIPYDKETRHSLQGQYGSIFKTKTELAEQQRRDLVKVELRDLGFEPRVTGIRDWLAPYSTEFLEELAGLLRAKNPNMGDTKQS